MGQMGQLFGWVIYGSWVDALSPMTHLHIYERHFSAFNARHIVISQRNLLFPETVEALSIVLEGYKKQIAAVNCHGRTSFLTHLGPLSSVYVSCSVTEIEHCCIFFWVFFYLLYIKHFLLFL